LGYIFAVNIIDIFRLAGQNPSKATEDKLLQRALQSGTGVIFFPEMLDIFEKHWHSNQFYVDELKDSIKTFSKGSTSLF
jgi:Ca2+-binding EF-hand superfamily protein